MYSSRHKAFSPIGRPQELVAAIPVLEDDSSYFTGIDLLADGGMT